MVGPESAGAHPGPACYRKGEWGARGSGGRAVGPPSPPPPHPHPIPTPSPRTGGPPTVTDANLCLGRLLPEFFPRIFGPGEDQPLCRDAALRALRGLAERVGAGTPGQPPMSVEEVAMGFIRVANEAMCRPIRALTQVGAVPRGSPHPPIVSIPAGAKSPFSPPKQARGHDTSRHVLACFGGAGGQHACAIARALGMKKVFIHKYAGGQDGVPQPGVGARGGR